MRSGIRKWQGVAGLTLVGGIGITIVWTIWPHEQNLIQHACKITSLNVTRQHAFWLCDDKLLMITCTNPLTRDIRKDDPSDWTGRADLLHINTGKRVPLRHLTTLLNRLHGMVEDVEVSPRGDWLAWHNTQGRAGLGNSALARLDGAGYRSVDDARGENTYWLDDQHWVVADPIPPNYDGKERLQVTVYNTSDPKADQQLGSGSTPGNELISNFYERHPASFEVEKYCSIQGDEPPEPCIEEFRTSSVEQGLKSPPLRTFSVNLPRSAEILQIGVSPQDRFIYYYLRYSYISPLDKLVRRLFKAYQVHVHRVESLWISRTDGQQVHEIGYVMVNGNKPAQITDIEWLPGGKRLSFDYNDMFYTVRPD